MPKFNYKTIIWFMICLIGCFIQTYDMTSLYFEREMNVETLNYPIDPVVPASIMLMAHSIYKKKCRTGCDNLSSTSKLLFDNMLRFDQIFPTYRFMLPDCTYDDFNT